MVITGRRFLFLFMDTGRVIRHLGKKVTVLLENKKG